MKKSIRVFTGLVLLAWLSLALSLSGEGKKEGKNAHLYLRVKGSALFSNGGDFGTFVALNRERYADLNAKGAYVISDAYDDFFKGYTAEVGFETEKHAIGLSIGHMKRTLSVDTHYDANFKVWQSAAEFSYSALPIFMWFHYKVIHTSFIRSYFTVGTGVYLTTYREHTAAEYLQGYVNTASVNRVEAKKNHLGVHVGVTCDLYAASFLALSVDAGYRFADFKNVSGVMNYEDDANELSSKGELYYSVNKQREGVRLGIGKIAGSKWDERLAQFNLSGFQAGVGLKITL